MRKLRPFLFPLLLVAAVFLAYANVYPFDYLYDDEFLLQKNRFLDSWSTFFEIFRHSSTGGAGFADAFYRPLQSVAYLVVTQLLDRETWVYHLLNVTLHAANAVLVYGLGRRLRFPALAALLGALLWAAHPLHTEAITYMSGTADPLGVFFLLLALNWMVPTFSRASLVGSHFLFVAALLSKESTIVFPALLVAMIFRLAEKPLGWRAYSKTYSFWGIAGVYFVLRHELLNFNHDFAMYKADNVYTQNFFVRVWTFLSTLPHYLELLAWPHGLHIDRDYPFVETPWRADVLLGAIIVGLGVTLCVRALRRPPEERGPAWAFLWFMAAYFPCSGLLIPVNSLFLEHWMYLPIVGLCLELGRLPLSFAASGARRFATATALAVCGAFAVAAFAQNEQWKDPVTLYSAILSHNPAVGRVRHNLAMALSDRGEDDKALREYQFILDHGGKYPETYNNLGMLLLKKRDFEGAEKALRASLEINPKFFPAAQGLVRLYRERGEPARAEEIARKLAGEKH